MLGLLVLAGCVSSVATRPAEVRGPAEVSARVAPHGQARIWPLAEGQNAFVGRLELEPGAVVPAHRDETEEFIVVLEGHGRVTIDGQTTAVGPGTAITMPANAEVSFVTGVDRLIAVQVFAGPGPAAKYDAWPALADAPIRTVAQRGPFTVLCAPTDCQVLHRGQAITEVWHYGRADAVVAAVRDVIGVPRDVWLVSSHQGDGCPVAYQALCLVDDRPVLTESFGNCDAPSGLRFEGGVVEITFVADLDPPTPRPAQTFTVDPWTCTLESADAR